MSQVRIHIDRNRRVSVQEIVLMLRQLREERAQVSLQTAGKLLVPEVPQPAPQAALEPATVTPPEDWFGLDQLLQEELTRQISSEVTQLLNNPTLQPNAPVVAAQPGQPLPWISELDEISSLLGEVNAPQPLLH